MIALAPMLSCCLAIGPNVKGCGDSTLGLGKALDVFGPDKHANNPFYKNIIRWKTQSPNCVSMGDTSGILSLMEQCQAFLMGMSEHQSFVDLERFRCGDLRSVITRGVGVASDLALETHDAARAVYLVLHMPAFN